MSDALESSPIPESAWTGRSWWQVGCGGCCLLILLTVVVLILMGSWEAAGLPRDILTLLKNLAEKIHSFL